MRIGIDASWAIYEQAGIGKYTYNLVKALLKSDRKNTYVLYFNFFKNKDERMQFIQDWLSDSVADVEIVVSAIPAAWREWLTQTQLPFKYLFKKEIDIYHSPFFAGVPKAGFPKMAVTIHDLVFMRFPDHRGKKLSNYYLKRTKTAVENCNKIISVSESTKKDLSDLLMVDERKVKVVYEGVDASFKPIRKPDVQRKLSKYFPKNYPYILSVGTLEPRKNLARLVKAYSLLPVPMRRKYKLVLVGGKGWNNSELNKSVVDMNLKEDVIFSGYIPQEDLPYFYNGAECFVYPSLYEGFGLPPLEAMACGTPVITSNVSSLKEVVGNSGILTDPKKEEEIAKNIKQVLVSESLSKKLRKKGLHQAKKFSWEKCAKETIKVYESLMEEK